MQIFLWTHPRSISTAFERIISERGDFKIIHEPFSDLYYDYDKKAKAIGYNGRYDFEPSYQNIKAYLLKKFADKNQYFIKDMAYHCWDYIQSDTEWLTEFLPVFLVRNPEASIASHYAMNDSVKCSEIGYDSLWQLYELFLDQGKKPLVILSEDLTTNPDKTLAQFEAYCKIPEKRAALNWKNEAPKEWQTWMSWHKDAAESKGIEQKKKTYKHTVQNHETLKHYWEFHLPFYEKLLKAAES